MTARFPTMPARMAMIVAAMLAFAGCQGEPGGDGLPARIVRVVTVQTSQLPNAITLTGTVQARKDVDVAFRIGGRMIERKVDVGDRVAAGAVLARLDPSTEQNALQAAKAMLVAARGEVVTTRAAFDRQQGLLEQGFTTRPRFDQAKQALETAQSRLEDAEARVDIATERLGYTELRADAAGVVTARGAEPGEVVQPGRMIARIARDDGRDAVFEAPAGVLQAGQGVERVRVSLVSDPTVTTEGRVREVSPEADPVTRTFQVRVGLIDPPEALRLGVPVNGSADLASSEIVAIPAAALTSSNRIPAVWIVDPATSTVSLRQVDILRFEPDSVVIAQGLEPGDVIVTAGVQVLHPGQRVKAIGAAGTGSAIRGSEFHNGATTPRGARG
jgi:RND family efflux transporter MFP subunit